MNESVGALLSIAVTVTDRLAVLVSFASAFLGDMVIVNLYVVAAIIELAGIVCMGTFISVVVNKSPQVTPFKSAHMAVISAFAFFLLK